MKKMITLLSLAFLALMQVPAASAASTIPNDIDNIDTYLSSSYFNGYTELTGINFTGQWQYTAIASEAGNENTVSPISGAGWNPSDASFSTSSPGNFGQWETIDFSTDQLFFEDSDGPFDIALDPFSVANTAFFRVFELTADSNSLSYLGANALTLAAGTIIVGFNDNGLGGGDRDYDDIIVALQPVPIPAAAFLFAPALLGFMGLRRRAKNKA